MSLDPGVQKAKDRRLFLRELHSSVNSRSEVRIPRATVEAHGVPVEYLMEWLDVQIFIENDEFVLEKLKWIGEP
jgi:hypothetical protein